MEDKLASKQDLQEFRTEFLHMLAQTESRLTITMGAMLAASVAILTAIQKFV